VETTTALSFDLKQDMLLEYNPTSSNSTRSFERCKVVPCSLCKKYELIHLYQVGIETIIIAHILPLVLNALEPVVTKTFKLDLLDLIDFDKDVKDD
jgi:hypothetical protein